MGGGGEAGLDSGPGAEGSIWRTRGGGVYKADQGRRGLHGGPGANGGLYSGPGSEGGATWRTRGEGRVT